MTDTWDAAGTVVRPPRRPAADDWDAAGLAVPVARGRPRSLGERFVENVVDAYRRGTLAGAAADALAVGQADATEQLQDVDGSRPFAGAGAAARAANRDDADAYAARAREDPWYRAGPRLSFSPSDIASGETARALGARVEAGAATLGGQFVGALPSPESWIGVGKNLIGRMASNAAVAGVTDPAVQALSREAGAQDGYDPWRTAGSVVIGAAIPAAMEAPRAAARLLEPPARPSRAAPEPRSLAEAPTPAPRAADWSATGTTVEAPPVVAEPPRTRPRPVPSRSVAPIDDDLWARQVTQESGGRQDAVSPKGAFGVAQLMPQTAVYIANRMGDPTLAQRARTDPAVNERMGRWYMDEQLRRFGDPAVALAAYNAGPGRARQWLRTIGDPRQMGTDEWVRRIPIAETRDYVTKIMRLDGAPDAGPLPRADASAAPPARTELVYDELPRRGAPEEPVEAPARPVDDALTRGSSDAWAAAGAPVDQRGGALADDALTRGPETRAADDDALPSFRPVRDAQVFAPRGEPIDATYGVIDLRDLVASHADDLTPNPRFPVDLQPRDRTRAASEAQVAEIASRLQPERLGETADAGTGAPVIGPDGVVESGNARTIALGRVYTQNGPQAEAYRRFLTDSGYPVEGVERPVLVRRRNTPLDNARRVAWTEAANDRATAAMSPAEQARADAGRLSTDLLDSYRGGGLELEANAPFVSRALSNLTTAADRGGLVDGNGRISAAGVARIRAAMTSKAYDDGALVSRLYEDARPELGTLGRAAQDAAPAWAGMRSAVQSGTVPREMDATRPLSEALSLMAQAREGKVRLPEMFGGTREAFGDRDPRVEQFIRLFHAGDNLGRVRSGPAIQADLEAYARAARSAETPSLLGEAPDAQSSQILDSLIRRARTADARKLADAPLLGEAVGGAPSRAVLAARGTPERGEGAVRSLDDMIGEMDARGVRMEALGDGPGGPVLGGLEGRWREAVEVLTALRAGDARAVLSHPDTGPIDVIWGNERGGLAHIAKDHPEVLADLPERLARMRVVRRPTENRVTLGGGAPNSRAVVRLAYDGRAKTWLLTAFEEEGQGVAGRTDSGGPDSRAGSPDKLAMRSVPQARVGSEWDAAGAAVDLDQLASRGLGLRAAPRTRAIPRQAGDEAVYRGATVSKLAKRLRDSMGLTARQGRMTLRKALGEYDTRSGVIRSRMTQELDVLSHEGGHALEYLKRPALTAALKKHAALLRPLAYPGVPPAQQRVEGFAEFFRWYVTNPDHARRVGGAFYDDFEAAIGKDAPQMLADLRAIQSAYQAFLAAPSASVVAASVVTVRRQPVRDLIRSTADDLGGSVARWADDAYASFVDDLHPINMGVRALQQIMAANRGRRFDLRAAKNPYALARLSRDAYGSGHMDLMHGVRPYAGTDPEGPSLAQALGVALGETWGKWGDDAIDQFGGYLVSRRAVYLWRAYEAGRIPNPPDKSSLETHEQAIRDFETANPTWAEAARMVYAWNDNLWRKEFDAGLITREQYDAGLNDHPDYVPFMRDMSDRERAGARAVSGPGKQAGGVRRLRGSTRDIINPIQSMMRRSYELSALIARNDVFKALDDLGQAAGRGAGAVVERIPDSETRGVTVDVLEALERAAKEAGVAPRDLTTMMDAVETTLDGQTRTTVARAGEINERGEPIIYVWRDGKRRPLRLPDGAFGKQMFTALTGMTQEMRSAVVDAMAAPTQLLRYGITTSPDFFAANYIRDQLSTWINTNVGYNPLTSGATGLAAEVRQGRTSRLYNSFGGVTGGANVAALGRGRFEQDINALRRKGYAVRRFASWQGFAAFTEVSETGTRLGVFQLAFKQARKDGLPEREAAVEAAFAARDYLDFGRSGSRMLAARRLVTFLNAAVQGLDRTVRVLSADGNLHRVLAPFGKRAPQTPMERRALGHAYKAWAKVSAIGVFGLALRALYENDPEYEEISDYLRATHWMAKIGGEWIAIPKPFELATLSNIFERAFEANAKNDSTAWKRLLQGFGETIVPPHEVPALAVPFQIAGNKDNQGRPIVPDHLRALEPEMQFNAYTSNLGRSLGEAINVSPAVIDHVVTGFGGSWGRTLLSATGNGRAESEQDLTDRWIARRFVRDVTRGSTSQKRFWELVARDGGELTRAEGSFRSLVGQGDDAKALAYLRGLKPVQRGYALATVFSEDSSKKLHPLMRAGEANRVLGELRRELSTGDVAGTTGQPIRLTPAQRNQADDALAMLQMTEMRNGLIATGVEGWRNKPPIPRRDAVERLRATSPQVADLLSLRMRVAKVPPSEASLEMWRRMGPLLEGPVREDALRRMMQRERMSGDKEDQLRAVQRAAMAGAS